MEFEVFIYKRNAVTLVRILTSSRVQASEKSAGTIQTHLSPESRKNLKSKSTHALWNTNVGVAKARICHEIGQ